MSKFKSDVLRKNIENSNKLKQSIESLLQAEQRLALIKRPINMVSINSVLTLVQLPELCMMQNGFLMQDGLQM